MPSVVRVTAELFEDIYQGALRPLNADLPLSIWRRAFEPRGWSGGDFFGYALMDEGRVVGLMGALFSDRQIDGQRRRFCNLHSWFVQPEYRGARSLLLLRPFLALEKTVLTDFSATPEVVAMFTRVGFEALGSEVVLLLPLPGLGAQDSILDLAADPSAARRVLSPADLVIFQDHQGIDCRHLLIQCEGQYCYLVASRLDGGGWPHVHVHYVSRPALLVRNHLGARRALLRGGARYAVIPRRLLGRERIPMSLSARASSAFCRPGDISPAAIDTLYSEMVLLKLPVVPRIPEPILKLRRKVLAVFR